MGWWVGAWHGCGRVAPDGVTLVSRLKTVRSIAHGFVVLRAGLPANASWMQELATITRMYVTAPVKDRPGSVLRGCVYPAQSAPYLHALCVCSRVMFMRVNSQQRTQEELCLITPSRPLAARSPISPLRHPAPAVAHPALPRSVGPGMTAPPVLATARPVRPARPATTVVQTGARAIRSRPTRTARHRIAAPARHTATASPTVPRMATARQ